MASRKILLRRCGGMCSNVMTIHSNEIREHKGFWRGWKATKATGRPAILNIRRTQCEKSAGKMRNYDSYFRRLFSFLKSQFCEPEDGLNRAFPLSGRRRGLVTPYGEHTARDSLDGPGPGSNLWSTQELPPKKRTHRALWPKQQLSRGLRAEEA